MNKIQYIKLLNLRGITELNGISVAEAVRQSGGDPTEKEMILVNEESMKYYLEKYIEQQKLNSELSEKINGYEKAMKSLYNDILDFITKNFDNLKNN